MQMYQFYLNLQNFMFNNTLLLIVKNSYFVFLVKKL